MNEGTVVDRDADVLDTMPNTQLDLAPARWSRLAGSLQLHGGIDTLRLTGVGHFVRVILCL
jgi:hypothetical protein